MNTGKQDSKHKDLHNNKQEPLKVRKLQRHVEGLIDYGTRLKDHRRRSSQSRPTRWRCTTHRQACHIPAAELTENDLPPTIVNFRQPNIWQNVRNSCKAYKFPNDQPGTCCNHGKTVIPPLQDPPHVLQDLLVKDKHFTIMPCPYQA